MITYEDLLKIESLFRTLQILDCPSVQVYDPTQENRCNCLFAKGLDWKRNCTSVHINFPLDEFRHWHLKNWDKRKKSILINSYAQIMEENIIRFVFEP